MDTRKKKKNKKNKNSMKLLAKAVNKDHISLKRTKVLRIAHCTKMVQREWFCKFKSLYKNIITKWLNFSLKHEDAISMMYHFFSNKCFHVKAGPMKLFISCSTFWVFWQLVCNLLKYQTVHDIILFLFHNILLLRQCAINHPFSRR